MSHTNDDIERAAERFERFDPASAKPVDTSDLRQLAEAVDALHAQEARIRELVALAHANGHSWGRIGIALGTSRQAARERFAEKTRS
jgi:hypothetical protein